MKRIYTESVISKRTKRRREGGSEGEHESTEEGGFKESKEAAVSAKDARIRAKHANMSAKRATLRPWIRPSTLLSKDATISVKDVVISVKNETVSAVESNFFQLSGS